MKRSMIHYPPKKLYSYMMHQQSLENQKQLEEQQNNPDTTPIRDTPSFSSTNSPAFTGSEPASPQWAALSPNMPNTQNDDILGVASGSPYLSPESKKLLSDNHFKLFDSPDIELLDQCLVTDSVGKNLDFFTKAGKGMEEQNILPTPPGSIDSSGNDSHSDKVNDNLCRKNLKVIDPLCRKTSSKPATLGKVKPPKHRGKNDTHLSILQSRHRELTFSDIREIISDDDDESVIDNSPKRRGKDFGDGKSSGVEAEGRDIQDAELCSEKDTKQEQTFFPLLAKVKAEAEEPDSVSETSNALGGGRGRSGSYSTDNVPSSLPTQEEVRGQHYSISRFGLTNQMRRRTISASQPCMSTSQSEKYMKYDMCDEVSSSNTSPMSKNSAHQLSRGMPESDLSPDKRKSLPDRMKMRVDSEASSSGMGSQQMKTSDSCQVCGDVAAGFHCGAFVCEACKKFFVRCLKQEMGEKFVCSRNKSCTINKETRTQCQYCRYRKCLSLGMYKPGSGPGGGKLAAEISNIPCKVCESPSSGYHFGAITCEGCKGFFRRTVKERAGIRYVCSRKGGCTITTNTRNICKYCRYQKCLQAGMTPDGSRIGRQPNSVKHATMLELQRIAAQGGLEGNERPLELKQEILSPPQDVLPENAEFELIDPSHLCDSDLHIAQKLAQTVVTKLCAEEKSVENSPESDMNRCNTSFPHPTHFQMGKNDGDPDENHRRHPGSYTFAGENTRTVPIERVSHQRETERTYVDPSDLAGLAASTSERSGQPKMCKSPPPNITSPAHPSVTHRLYEFQNTPWSQAQSMTFNQQHLEIRQKCDESGEASRFQCNLTENKHDQNKGLMDPPGGVYVASPPEHVRYIDKGPSLVDKARFEKLMLSAREYERIKQERIAQERRIKEREREERLKLEKQMEAESRMKAKVEREYWELHQANNMVSVEGLPRFHPVHDITQQHSMRTEELRHNISHIDTSHQAAAQTAENRCRVQPHPLHRPFDGPSSVPQHLQTGFREPHDIHSDNVPRNLTLPKLQTLSNSCPEGLLRRSESDLEEITSIISKAITSLNPISQRNNSLVELSEDLTVAELWSAQMHQFGQSGPAVIKFAKKIPGFPKFPLSIQIAKVQMSMYPVVLSILSKDFNEETRTYNYFNMTDREKFIIFSKFPFFRVIGDHLLNMGHSINMMKLDDIEIGYLCALFLISSSTPPEEEKCWAPQMEADLIAALQQYCMHKDPHDKGRDGHILLRIGELRTCNMEHQKAMIQLTVEHPAIEMPQLFAETYLNI